MKITNIPRGYAICFVRVLDIGFTKKELLIYASYTYQP